MKIKTHTHYRSNTQTNKNNMANTKQEKQIGNILCIETIENREQIVLNIFVHTTKPLKSFINQQNYVNNHKINKNKKKLCFFLNKNFF